MQILGENGSLKKNPFKRELAYHPAEGGTHQSQQLEQIRQEASMLSNGMQLWSITAAPSGACCMIDDKVLFEGDTYKGMTVKSIADKKVVLEYKGTPVELKMD